MNLSLLPEDEFDEGLLYEVVRNVTEGCQVRNGTKFTGTQEDKVKI